jgi:hypothetical protein
MVPDPTVIGIEFAPNACVDVEAAGVLGMAAAVAGDVVVDAGAAAGAAAAVAVDVDVTVGDTKDTCVSAGFFCPSVDGVSANKFLLTTPGVRVV